MSKQIIKVNINWIILSLSREVLELPGINGITRDQLDSSRHRLPRWRTRESRTSYIATSNSDGAVNLSQRFPHFAAAEPMTPPLRHRSEITERHHSNGPQDSCRGARSSPGLCTAIGLVLPTLAALGSFRRERRHLNVRQTGRNVNCNAHVKVW